MTAPRHDPPARESGRPRRIDEPATIPDDLVIPPKPPLPDIPGTASETDAASVPEPGPEDAAIGPVAAASEADAAPAVQDEPEPAALEQGPLEDADGDAAIEDADPDIEGEAAEATDLLAGLRDDAATSAGSDAEPALVVAHLTKRFGSATAVDDLSLRIEAGAFYGLVGPNGAGKTTTLSMIAGLLRPDAGEIRICGTDARAHEREAKRLIGVLPDRLRTFDRLTGRQLLTYAGLLRDLPGPVVAERVASLAHALDLDDALGRVVSDYSAGMTKKVMLAAAMIHAPRLLVLDEPFEALDPASSAAILEILRSYAAQGGAVVLSSHGMELIERVCDRVAVIAGGRLLAEGTVDEVRGEGTLTERFVEIVGGGETEGLEWLYASSD